MSLDINRDNFENEISASEKPVMVDFWGPQCKPCLALMPSVEQLDQDYSDRLKIAKVNAAENRLLCAKLRVMSLPTFVFYKDGIEVSRLVGEDITIEKIVDAINTVLKNK